MLTAHSLWTKFRRLVLQRGSGVKRNQGSRRSLALESLELRRVLSVSPTQVKLSDANLVIYGTDSAETVTVSETRPGVVSVLLEAGGQSLSQDFDKTQISKVYFFGRDGDDIFRNMTALPSVAKGEGGNDTLIGGSGADDFDGGDGNDTLLGREGDDSLKGGGGDDWIDGGAGNDTLSGHGGDDMLIGGAGNDFIRAGEGNDRVYGDEGNDRIFGDSGNDLIYGGDEADDIDGGDGDDTIYGGAGNDRLRGNAGDDRIFGDEGDDVIYGHDGNDQLYGGDGADYMRGGTGHDYLDGQGGDDTLFGDEGNDSISGGDGNDKISGGDGNDTLRGGRGNDSLSGEVGDDRIFGDEGDDNIYGHDGNDQLFGGEGADLMRGGAGNDYLNGQGGDDTMFGDEGNDSLTGGDGNDRIYGGDGNDTLQGGTGHDSLSGDAGDDRIFGDDGDDTLSGGDGDDDLRGGDGADHMRGGVGNDYLNGQGGDDTMFGDEGNDNLSGGDGNDNIRGGDNNDLIKGGRGNDSLSGDAGDDQIFGDEGDDTLTGGDGDDHLQGGEGADVIRGGEGNDILLGQGGDDFLFGDGGADTLYGGDGADTMEGGDGNDLLDGGVGDDNLQGDGGDDVLYGGDGDDRMSGGDGNDRLFAGAGNDVLRGGVGDDYLWGEDGDDYLIGDEGNDSLSGGSGNDQIYGVDGNDILLGDAGDDLLNAGNGNDILIGGAGVDALSGGMGDDILIGGLVSHDPALLELLRTQWTSGMSYHHRVHAIEDKAFAAFLHSEETVFDDYVADSVIGGDDLDWFFLPGALSIYDLNGMHSSGMHEHNHHSHGGHGVHVIDHPPIVEGFDLIDSLDRLVDVNGNEAVHTIVPHVDNGSKQNEHLALFELVRYDQVTHYAVKSGNWSDPHIWHDGVVPTNGARVLVPIGVQVNVDRVLATEIATLRIDGVLAFATQVNTQLKVDTAVVSDAGMLMIGSESNPIAAHVTAKIIFTDNGAIDRTWDPYGISRGLITHGAVQMHGAVKSASLELVGDVRAGATVLTLAGVPTGWRIGDTVVIAGTSATGNQSEERTILGISGSSILVSPLAYDHLTFSQNQSVHIANTTRNIVLDSEANVTARRGHVMFMHNPDVHISYAGFYKLGRTDKSIIVNDPQVDANWNLVPGTGTNPRARYAVHFHRTGTSVAGSPATVHGSVVSNNTGWGFVNHSSYVDFTNNVAHNVVGAGFVTEVGDEIGSFRNNLAIDIASSGGSLRDRDRLVQQDFGHTGDGFWFQGAGISVVGNVAANAEGHAFIYQTRAVRLGGADVGFLASNLPDPSIASNADSIPVDYVPVFEFSGNVGYASGSGLSVWYNLRNAPHDAKSVFQDSLFWNNTTGVEVPYSHSAILQNLTIQHEAYAPGSVGVGANAVSKDIIYSNLNVSGYSFGIQVAQRGYSIVNGGTYATRTGVVVYTGVEPGRRVIVQGNFRMIPLPFEILGAREQTEVANSYRPFGDSIDHLFYDSKVFLNYGFYRGQQLYSGAQQADFIPFPEGSPSVPSAYVGLNVQQLSSFFGKTMYGEIAPASVLQLPELGGLLQFIL